MARIKVLHRRQSGAPGNTDLPSLGPTENPGSFPPGLAVFPTPSRSDDVFQTSPQSEAALPLPDALLPRLRCTRAS